MRRSIVLNLSFSKGSLRVIEMSEGMQVKFNCKDAIIENYAMFFYIYKASLQKSQTVIPVLALSLSCAT